MSFFTGGYDDNDLACHTIDPICSERLVAIQAKAHKNFETRLCQELRASGMDTFAQADNCSFSIVENPGSASTRLAQDDTFYDWYQARNRLTTAVEVSLRGLSAQPTVDAVKFMQGAIVETHNVAFTKFRYALFRLEIVNVMMPHSYDDDACFMLGHVIPRVGTTSVSPSESEIATLHRQFETVVCHMLRDSGYEAFANVSDCTFRFVYNPARGAISLANHHNNDKHAAAVVTSG